MARCLEQTASDTSEAIRHQQRELVLIGLAHRSGEVDHHDQWSWSEPFAAAGSRSQGRSFAAAAATPLVGFTDSAREDRAVRLETLAGHDEPQLVEAAEGGQIGAGERAWALADGSVGHVEVFRVERVGAFILGRPRRTAHRCR